jgi:hypothetical protein
MHYAIQFLFEFRQVKNVSVTDTSFSFLGRLLKLTFEALYV